jgi:hypothetical protein
MKLSFGQLVQLVLTWMPRWKGLVLGVRQQTWWYAIKISRLVEIQITKERHATPGLSSTVHHHLLPATSM